MKIMIDAGHGYNTPGKRSPDGMMEYEFNRAVALYTKQQLENDQNVTVYFSHSDKKDVPLKERTDLANSLRADLFISIHANAHGNGTWNDVRGIETYIAPFKPPVAFQLARKVQQQLILATGLRDRGVKTADFHVLRETKMDAVLVEFGFMTNKDESKLLRSESYRKTCAIALASAVASQFGLKLSSHPAPVQKGLYKVQAGAFQDREKADELADRLKKDGFDPYIYFE